MSCFGEKLPRKVQELLICNYIMQSKNITLSLRNNIVYQIGLDWQINTKKHSEVDFLEFPRKS